MPYSFHTSNLPLRHCSPIDFVFCCLGFQFYSYSCSYTFLKLASVLLFCERCSSSPAFYLAIFSLTFRPLRQCIRLKVLSVITSTYRSIASLSRLTILMVMDISNRDNLCILLSWEKSKKMLLVMLLLMVWCHVNE